jgi:excisionase family DNA binding protein
MHQLHQLAILPVVYLPTIRRSDYVMSQLMKVREVARTLGVHENTVRRWEERGLLRAVRLPSGVRRFRPEDVEAVRAEMFSGFAPLREDEDVVPVTRVRSID